jgi:septal ring factor EnvC (AmiA/AmiB activator)
LLHCALAGFGVLLLASGVLGQSGEGLGVVSTVGRSGGIGTDVELAKLFDDIATSRAKQRSLEEQSASVATQRDKARQELSGQVRALYRITHPGLSPAILGMSAVLRHVGRVKRLRHIVELQAQGLQSLEVRAASLVKEDGEVIHAIEQAQTRLSALRAVSRVDGESDRGQREPSHYGLRIVDGSPVTPFESERGRLGSPVAGDVHIVPGRVAESDGPGLEFQAPVGTAVRAVAPGRVAFSDRYGGYGRLVILDHGRGYYTAYGGLGGVDVRVGDDLQRQDRIGDVGNELSPAALFFEIRKDSRTLDPQSWLGYGE